LDYGTDKDEALRLALEALELMYACYAHPDWVSHKQQEEKILAQCVATTMTLRQAIKAVLEAKDESLVWNGGVPAMLPKQKEGETFIVSYEPKLEAKDEPVAVKRMMGWVEGLKRQSDNGKYLHIPSGLNSGMCWELANELEQFINTTPPQQEAKDKPVAWMCADESLINKGYARFSHVCMGEWKIPVYTTPPPVAEPHKRKPLTNQQIAEILERGDVSESNDKVGWYVLPYSFARAIEAAHGIIDPTDLKGKHDA
jgi:hypothetical protein